MKVVFKFVNISDMISLAKRLQTSVYWNHTYSNEDDEEREVPASDMWEVIEETVEHQQAKGIWINIESDSFGFIYEEDE